MIGIVGLDYHQAPMAVRERLAFAGEALREALVALKRSEALSEVVILSTCNRTEIYGAGPSWSEARQVIEAFLARYYLAGGPATPGAAERAAAGSVAAVGVQGLLSNYLMRAEGLEAARHLFQVAAGLRSMQMGESQILGQVKEALTLASRAGSVGEELHALFTTALRLGKRVRSETAITRADVSISRAAVDLARDALGSLKGRSVLLIGAGRTNQLCARLLRAEGAKRLILANRTAETAQEAADALGAEAASLSALPALIPQVQLIISATAAPHIVLSAATVAQACQGRHTPLVILDLAVPRDVEETAGLLPAVCLYNIDALQGYGKRSGRAADLEHMGQMVEDAVLELHRWQQVRKVAPAIAALRQHVDSSQQLELARAMAQLEHLNEHDREVVRQFGQRMVDKMFHHLVSRVRTIAQHEPADGVVDLMMRLFAVPPVPASQQDAGAPSASQAPPRPVAE
jgi:glutamyl-tRNA reductase